MDKSKITVKMNGEKINDNMKQKSQPLDFTPPVYDEQAAMTEKTMTKSKKSFAREKGRHSLEMIKRFKPLIVAIMTALLIGLVFGVLLLKLFTSADNGLAQPNNNPVVHLDTTEKEQSETQTSKVTLPAIQAYIVQGGLFAEEGNAEELVADYQEKDVSTVVWQEDKQYYVMTGVTGSRETAEKLAKQQEKEGLEAFVKEWETSSIEIELTQIEEEWLVSFCDLLMESINRSATDEQLAVGEWNTLFEQDTSDSKKITSFRETIDPWTQAITDKSLSVNQYELLSLWYEFEQFLTDNKK